MCVGTSDTVKVEIWDVVDQGMREKERERIKVI